MSKQSYIRKKTGLTDRISRIFLLIALVVIALIFQIIQPRFLMMNNVMNLLATSSIIGGFDIGEYDPHGCRRDELFDWSAVYSDWSCIRQVSCQ